MVSETALGTECWSARRNSAVDYFAHTDFHGINFFDPRTAHFVAV